VIAKAKRVSGRSKNRDGQGYLAYQERVSFDNVVVVVIVLLISVYLGACDIVLAKLMRFILG